MRAAMVGRWRPVPERLGRAARRRPSVPARPPDRGRWPSAPQRPRPVPARLRPADLARVGGAGPRSRPLRAALSAPRHPLATPPAGGTWLNPGPARYPAVVLGATAAQLLGVGAAGPDVQVWLGGHWFTVIGILDPVPLAPELDPAALVGWPVAGTLLGFDGHPT